VGFLTIVLAVWLWKVETRRWIRRLGLLALGAVILQGVLGGLTVLLLLPAPVSIGHAALAQLFFCSTVALALFTSAGWRAAPPAPDDGRLRRLALLTTVVVYGQILLGATMRHTEAGLAIPDFPLAFGGVLPPAWNAAIAIHYAHRVGALIVLVAVYATAIRVWRHHPTRMELVRPALLLVLFVGSQVTLGGYVVWSGLQPMVNTAHVVNGALVLATSLVLTLRAYRGAILAWEQAPAVRKPGLSPLEIGS
jgi:cytochrome c oxidase assembly protein subunit 15